MKSVNEIMKYIRTRVKAETNNLNKVASIAAAEDLGFYVKKKKI